MDSVRVAGVIGAGVMGAGIAALFANAGVGVILLDLDPSLAAAGLARQVKLGAFDDATLVDGIRVGSSVSDLALLAQADWIVEAAIERLDVKRQIFGALDGVRKPGSIVSSNTSTILLAKLISGMDLAKAQDILITHFFNPPRLMPLMELIAGPIARPEAAEQVAEFAERRLGRFVVRCRDTPGFIANRIGNYWMAVALHEAVANGLDVEEADAVIGKPFGLPAGIFVLLDLVGIDLLPAGWASLQSSLPAEDPIQAYPAEPPLIARMIAEGRIGRKSGAGFRRRAQDGTFEVIDLASGEYRPSRPVVSAALDASQNDLRALMSHESPGGRFAATVMESTLAYAASLVPEIADLPQAIDQAMRWGYGWQQGPFELIQRIGAKWLVDHLGLRHFRVPQPLVNLASGLSPG